MVFDYEEGCYRDALGWSEFHSSSYRRTGLGRRQAFH